MKPYLDDVAEICHGIPPADYPEIALKVVAYRKPIQIGSDGWRAEARETILNALKAQAGEAAA